MSLPAAAGVGYRQRSRTDDLEDLIEDHLDDLPLVYDERFRSSYGSMPVRRSPREGRPMVSAVEFLPRLPNDEAPPTVIGRFHGSRSTRARGGRCRHFLSDHVAGAHVMDRLKDLEIECRNHAHDEGVDKPEVEQWTWPL